MIKAGNPKFDYLRGYATGRRATARELAALINSYLQLELPSRAYEVLTDIGGVLEKRYGIDDNTEEKYEATRTE